MLQTEMIGKVVMNYKHYTGVDLYSDGAVEDDLLNIVMNHHPSEYPDFIEKRASWPVFYHLSEQRGNIVDWMPIPQGAKVLEVGAGCGAVTSAIAKKNVQLTCVELSRKRSLINAYRNRDKDGIMIHVGNFRDIEPELDRDFAFIFLIGVFEYGASYIGGDRPFESFLYMLQRHLAPGGRIVIAIENRLGLKYFAGCKEDHAGKYFTGIEGYRAEDPARTFSKDTLTRLIRSTGITEYHFYYPYPDYKFMTCLHSDQYLPREGDFIDNVYNFDNDRLVLFNEKRAFDALARDRIYPEFANSFEVVIGPAFPTIFVKYSNDRADEFKIRTDIALDTLGRMQIHKYPMSAAAHDHIRSMSDAYTTLTDRYRGGDIAVNDCQLDQTQDAAIFSFVNGVTLSSLMDQCLVRGDLAGFDALFREYLRRISYREDYPAADFDLIFSNILVNGPVWTIIDYEWTYGKRIATRDIAFRALYCYTLEDRKRQVINVDRYYAELGLDAAMIEQLKREEADFQKYVTGGRKSLVEIWKLLDYKHEAPPQLLTTETSAVTLDRIQVYVDRGNGYSEADSYFSDPGYDKDGNAELTIRFESGMKAARVDPAFAHCIVTIKRMEWNGKTLNDENAPVTVQPNGAWLSDDSLVFDTDDPHIEFTPDADELIGRRGNTLTLSMSMVVIPRDVAENLYNYQLDTPEEPAAAPEPSQTLQPQPTTTMSVPVAGNAPGLQPVETTGEEQAAQPKTINTLTAPRSDDTRPLDFDLDRIGVKGRAPRMNYPETGEEEDVDDEEIDDDIGEDGDYEDASYEDDAYEDEPDGAFYAEDYEDDAEIHSSYGKLVFDEDDYDDEDDEEDEDDDDDDRYAYEFDEGFDAFEDYDDEDEGGGVFRRRKKRRR